MLIKFITKYMRPLGMFILFTFAVLSIFAAGIVRDLDEKSYFSDLLDYTINFENRFYDFRIKKRIDPHFKSPEIVLVKIDDYSLEKLGVWPIPRTNHAKLLDKLHAFGAKVAAFDVFFPEKSPSINGISPDTVFASSIKNFQTHGGRVFLPYTLAITENAAMPEAPVEMLDNTIDVRITSEANLLPRKIDRFTFPIEELIVSGSGVGNIESLEDSDGVFRHYPLITNVDTIYYGSMGFNAFEAYTKNKYKIEIYDDGTAALEINGKKMEITPHGETKVRYVGSKHQFHSVSFYDLINTPDNNLKMKELLNGKIVYIGSTALGAHDLRNTPVDSKMPGVYAHINMTHMLLHQYFFKDSNSSVKYSLLILCLGMILFAIIQRVGNPFLDASIIIGIIISTYYLDLHYFLPQGYELKLFYCFNCFLASYTWNTFLNFWEANKEKKQIRGTFARYVAPTIVDEMLKNPELLHVGGTKKDITCLFSDVRDFTKISEGMSATELAHSLNIYMGAMTDIVFDTKGTLDKYIGDAIVAIWGAPLEIGNHAQYAVEGAIKMMEILPDINEKFIKLGRPVFNVGIGLNSGECSVGNMGSARIFSYTALGDNMNLGARLEGLCKYYGTQILITEMTLARLDLTHIKTRPIDKVIVKGKTTAVVIHEVLHPHHWMAKDSGAHSSYLDAIKLFEEKNFIASLEIFNMLLMVNSQDKPTMRYSDICQKYLDHPELVTETFDITTMTEK